MIISSSLLMLALAATGKSQALDRKDLERRASAEDRIAIHSLCYSQLYGIGLPKNPRRAFRWCKVGAEIGMPGTQTLLAEMYRFGIHVKQDDMIARQWYEAAAKQGHVHAQLMLGRLILQYAKSNEESQNACVWFLAASDAGYEKADEQLEELDQSFASFYKGKPPREHFCNRP
jgi:TPR repeat protein